MPLHTVTFEIGVYGSLLSGDLVQEVAEGYDASIPEIAVEEGWSFTGWDVGSSSVASSLTVTAQYLPEYTVTFQLGDYGELLSGDLVQSVTSGKSAIAPAISAEEGWTFTGWDRIYHNISRATTAVAQYVLAPYAGIIGERFNTPSDAAVSFGSSFVINGDTAVIGMSTDDRYANEGGSVYVYARDGSNWSEQANFSANDVSENSKFGYNVALYGDTLLVASYCINEVGDRIRCVYVFVRSGLNWTQEAKLMVSGSLVSDVFGASISVNGDTAIIGAPGDDNKGSAYIFTRDINNSWNQIIKLTAGDGVLNDNFGRSVCLSRDLALIGAPYYDGNNSSSGKVYAFSRQGGVWTESASLSPSDLHYQSLFGTSLSMSGNTALIGASRESGNYNFSGSAYVFVFRNGIWTQEAKLFASDGSYNDYFGFSVSISGDTALIGAYDDDNNGSAYVYLRSGTTWTEDLKLSPESLSAGSNFGRSLSLSGDGALVAAPLDDSGDGNSGSLYFYDFATPPVTVTFNLNGKATRMGGGSLSQLVATGQGATAPEIEAISGWYFSSWDIEFSDVTEDLTVTALFLPEHTVTFDLGGYGDLLSGEIVQSVPSGKRAVAPELSSTDGWSFVGWSRSYSDIQEDITVTALYSPTSLVGVLEKKVSVDKTWSVSQVPNVSICGDTMLVGDYFDGKNGNGSISGSVYVYVLREGVWLQQAKLVASDGDSEDKFGSSLSLSGDIALIGAPRDEGGGSAYIFVRDGETWLEQAKLTGSDNSISWSFGSSVSLDGETALIGANSENGFYSNEGVAYIFTKNGNVWTEKVKLMPTDRFEGDLFGWSTCLKGDTAIIGAPSLYTDIEQSGSAHIFVKNGEEWIRQAELSPSDGAPDDFFGAGVGLVGDTVIIGSPYDDDKGSSSGSAYVYVRDGESWTEQQKLVTEDGSEGDRFGISISMGGDNAIIGSPYDDDKGSNAGSVYLYAKTGDSWFEKRKIVASDGSEGDRFGFASSVSDTNYAIGAFSYSGPSVYVYDFGVSPVTVSFDLVGKSSRVGGGDLVQLIPYGGNAISPEISDLAGWHFVGWDQTFDNITESITVTAQYVPVYTVTFNLGSYGSIASGDLVQEIVVGNSAMAPEIIVSGGWDFNGWDQTFDNITEDVIVTAQYVPIYTVIFNLGSYGSLVSGELVQDVVEGYSAVAPEISIAEDWRFIGWDQSYDDITENIFVEAQYAPSDLTAVLLQSKFTASDGSANDLFGVSVSVSGNTSLIGALRDGDNGTWSGSAYIYNNKDGVFIEQAKLVASDGESNDSFGRSVSINGDTALIGASGDDGKGSAYVFVRRGGMWVEQAKLVASDGAVDDRFGLSLSVSGDTAIIGASNDDGRGSAYVYVRNSGVWTEQAKLTASDGALNDSFGYSVSLSGNTAVIGAYVDQDNGYSSGSAYIFVRTDGVWLEQAKLIASDAAANDNFGYSVSVSGETSIVGSYGNDDNGSASGSVYVYVRSNGVWTEQEKLTASDGSANDRFGQSVSLSGNTAVISSSGDNDRGSAYVYIFKNGVWIEDEKLTASDGSLSDFFGSSVSVSGDAVLIGASGDDDHGLSSGSAYIFDLGVPPVTVNFNLGSYGNRTGGGELVQLVKINTAATAPLLNLNPGWLFNQWDADFLHVTSDLNVTALYSIDPNDTDGDRLLDTWERLYFTLIENVDGSADFDLDGRSDYDEFVSGSHPKNSASYFHVMDNVVSPVDGKIMLRFTTSDDVPKRRYRIRYTDNLSATDWPELPLGVFAPDAGDSTEKTFDAPGPEDAYFFKIEAFIEE